MLEHDTQSLTLRDTPSRNIGTPLPAGKYIPAVDQMVAAWLHAKLQRSLSENTLIRYRRDITDFRLVLHQAGCDLDGDPGLIATLAQGWASRPMLDDSPDSRPAASTVARYRKMQETGVGPSTYNGHICALSSFYEYAIKHTWFPANPMKMVEPRKVTARDYARPLAQEDMDMRLSRIDRSTLMGKRDYALILLAVMTGRRIAELGALRWGDISFDSRGRALIIWRHCKGGKQMEDELQPGTQAALVDLMHALYGPEIENLPPETPLWVCLSSNQERAPLGDPSIRYIWIRRLGTGKVHTTRHTFAVAMEGAGAKLSDIGARLGHANLATTSVYMQRLHSAENPYAAKLEQGFMGNGQHPGTGEAPSQERLMSKRERIDQAIAEHPELSNAAMGRLLGVDASTVLRHRQALGKQRPRGTNQYSRQA